jgi:formylglycine-generating enzyme required for sulfatase activity
MRYILLLLGLLPAFAYALDAPVVGITATTDGDSVYVTLAWDPVPGANRYHVFRQEQFHGTSTLVSDIATSPFHTSVPTGWNWQQQSDVLSSFSVKAAKQFSYPGIMINVPSGTFVMGQANASGGDVEHVVSISREFFLSRTEISNSQYQEAANWAIANNYASIVDNNLYSHGQYLGQMPGNNDHPKVLVTWYGAACYCDWLSLMEGLAPYYNGVWNPSLDHNPYFYYGYRLPTDAEWEYAARYGDGRTYPWGETSPVACQHANFNQCAGGTSPVGSYPDGNTTLGFQDMAGNVWEWCNDWYVDYDNNELIDPFGPSNGTYRVGRGSTWYDGPEYLKCATRANGLPTGLNEFLGFRICKSNAEF